MDKRTSILPLLSLETLVTLDFITLRPVLHQAFLIKVIDFQGVTMDLIPAALYMSIDHLYTLLFSKRYD